MLPSILPRVQGLEIVLVAPNRECVPEKFSNVIEDAVSYSRLIEDIQKFRGRIYFDERAIPESSLGSDGRHILDIDLKSWHMIVISANDKKILGVMRSYMHDLKNEIDLDSVQAFKLTQRLNSKERERYEQAMIRFINCASARAQFFAESGGWAVDRREQKRTLSTLVMAALSTLLHVSGTTVGLGTATERNNSSEILKKLGGFSIEDANGEVLPPFFDMYYNCEMEILGFYSESFCKPIENTTLDIVSNLHRVRVLTA